MSEKDKCIVKITGPENGLFEVDTTTDGQTWTKKEQLSENAINDLIRIYSGQGYKIDDQRNVQTFGANEALEPSYKPEDYDSLMLKCIELPHSIKAHERKITALVNKETGTKNRMLEIERGLYANVSSELEEPRLKYPSLKGIDAETEKRVNSSKTLSKIKLEIYGEVSLEETEDKGDKKKKFSSEKAKEAETTKRLYEDNRYQEHVAKTKQSVKEETEDGRYKFSNDIKRDIEVKRRAKENEEYKQLVEGQTTVGAEMIYIKQERDCQIREVDALKKVIKLLEIKLRLF